MTNVEIKTIAWMLLATVAAICVYVDAWRRGVPLRGALWAMGTWFLSLIVVPLWYAKRPLRAGERKRGGLHGFSVIWVAALSFNAALLGIVDGRIWFALAYWIVAMFVSGFVIQGISHLLSRRAVVERGLQQR